MIPIRRSSLSTTGSARKPYWAKTRRLLLVGGGPDRDDVVADDLGEACLRVGKDQFSEGDDVEEAALGIETYVYVTTSASRATLRMCSNVRRTVHPSRTAM